MQNPPNIHNTTIRKQARQHCRTFTRNIKRTRTTTINNTIKDRVEVAAQKSRNRRVNSIGTPNKKIITVRITIRGINTGHTKDSTTKSQLDQNKTTIKFTHYRLTLKNRPIQNSHPTRMNRTKRTRTQKTKTRKPWLEISKRNRMCLLQTNYRGREMWQPLEEPQPPMFIPQPIYINWYDRKSHK